MEQEMKQKVNILFKYFKLIGLEEINYVFKLINFKGRKKRR